VDYRIGLIVLRKTNMNQEHAPIIKETAEKLFSLLGITSAISISHNDDSIDITVEGQEENGILIGYHGETLEALQLISALTIAKQTGTFYRVSIEIGEYKKNRMEYLQNLVQQTKERVMGQQGEVPLPNLKAWERRYVHTLLADDPDVMTESTGEGRDRTLVVYPKQ
jgi:spoIIIJ-associated protein